MKKPILFTLALLGSICHAQFLPSATPFQQQLDQFMMNIENGKAKVFDEKLDSIVYEWYNPHNQEFSPILKYGFIYEENPVKITQYRALRDVIYNRYDTNLISTYTLDYDNKMLRIKTEQWVEDFSAFKPQKIDTLVFNDLHQLTQVKSYNYSLISDTLQLLRTRIYQYQQNLLSNIHEINFTGTALDTLNTSTETFTRVNGSELWIERTAFINQDIVSTSKDISFYDTDGNLTERLHLQEFPWQTTTDTISNLTLEYNLQSNPLRQNLNFLSEPSDSLSMSYYNGLDLDTALYYKATPDPSQPWFLDLYRKLEYDFSQSQDNIRYPMDVFFMNYFKSQSKVIHETIYVESGGTFEIDNRLTYHYSTDVLTHTESNKLSEANPLLFPNPAQNSILVRLPPSVGHDPMQLNIFQLNGQLIKSMAITNNENIDITTLKPGFYIYQIKSKKETWVGKLNKI